MGQGYCDCKLRLMCITWTLTFRQPGGQDSQLVVKDLATCVSANYLLQTNDEPPAFICVKTSGWRTGSKDVLERLQDPAEADGVNPNSYRFRLNVELETGDERYGFVNTLMWVGSGCRRGAESKTNAILVYESGPTMLTHVSQSSTMHIESSEMQTTRDLAGICWGPSRCLEDRNYPGMNGMMQSHLSRCSCSAQKP